MVFREVTTDKSGSQRMKSFPKSGRKGKATEFIKARLLGAALRSQPEDRVSNGVELAIMRYLESEFEDSGIDRSTDIFALGYVNSLFALELVTFVERAFDITVGTDDLDLDNFRSAEAMARLVGNIRAAEPGR